jgi:hypothetical protein
MPAVIVLGLLTLLNFATKAAAAAGDRPQGVVPGQYIVVFHDDVARPRDLADALALWHGFSLRHAYEHALKGFAARMPAAVARALAGDPDVAMVEPDVYAYANSPVIATGVARIGAAPNPTPLDCSAVDIAIIDTGIDLNHPDLNVNVAQSRSFVGDNTGSPDDDNGHGTHVSGIAAAHNGLVGVCPGARLWAIKVLDSSGGGYFSDIIEGIDYVTANAPGNGGQIAVANMSLGGTGYLASLRIAIQNSVAKGVVYVVAAGNSAMDVYGANGHLDTASDYNAFLCAFLGQLCGDDFIPAAYPEVATISAMVDSDGQPSGLGGGTTYGSDDSFASFSNFSNSVDASNPVVSPGRAIDLLMPGVNIYSTWNAGTYATLSGTSMASPHAAGLAALYVLAHTRATNAGGVYAIRQALINGGVAQNSSKGLQTLNDRDPYWENIGWAGAPPPPDFATSATPASLTLNPGQSGNATVTVTSLNGFNSSVGLSVNGCPANATCSFNPGSVTPPAAGSTTSTLTVVTNASTPFGTYSLYITGTDPSGATHTATVALNVQAAPPDFGISLSASSLTVKRGSNGSVTVNLTAIGGNSSVSLSISGLPSRTTASFTPNPVTATGNSTLKITADRRASVHNGYTLTITGANSSHSHSTILKLNIQ